MTLPAFETRRHTRKHMRPEPTHLSPVIAMFAHTRSSQRRKVSWIRHKVSRATASCNAGKAVDLLRLRQLTPHRKFHQQHLNLSMWLALFHWQDGDCISDKIGISLARPLQLSQQRFIAPVDKYEFCMKLNNNNTLSFGVIKECIKEISSAALIEHIL